MFVVVVFENSSFNIMNSFVLSMMGVQNLIDFLNPMKRFLPVGSGTAMPMRGHRHLKARSLCGIPGSIARFILMG